jgi:hypothetical protein
MPVKRIDRHNAEYNRQEPGRTASSAEIVQNLRIALREYTTEHPETVALWCFGIGFVLGWKLKPW